MKKEKILTIVTPAYNIESYVNRAIESVLACKSLEDIEMIVVDDGSTDKTGKIVEALCERAPESLKCIHKENGHYGSAVTRGIKEASGRYFKIIDGDDWVNSDGLDDLVTYLKAHPNLDMVVTRFQTVNEDGSLIKESNYGFLPTERTLRLEFELMDPVEMHATTFRTAILKDNGIELDGGVPFTDVEFILFPMPYVREVGYLPEVVYIYLLGRDGQSADASLASKHIDPHRFVLQQLLDWYSDFDWRSEMSNAKMLVEKRLGIMGLSHFSRYLMSGVANIDDVLELEECMKKMEEIYPYYTCTGLKLLRRSNFTNMKAVLIAYKIKRLLLKWGIVR